MKTIKKFTLFIFLLGFSFVSCSSGDETKINADILYQTGWKGILEEGGKERGSIGLRFNTDSTGDYELQFTNDGYLTNGGFHYRVENKLIVIESDLYISGSWFITTLDKNALILEKGSSAIPNSKSRIILSKEN